MKRIKPPILITECSPWFSWFAWYPITCRDQRGTAQVWLERVDYRVTQRNGLYFYEYRLPQSDEYPTVRIPLSSKKMRRRS